MRILQRKTRALGCKTGLAMLGLWACTSGVWAQEMDATLADPADATGIAARGQTALPPNPQIDYAGFTQLTLEVADYRKTRLIDKADFFRRAQEQGAILLDTRSAADFAVGHLAGAVNLPFSEFTEVKLRAVLGENYDRPILIYCNNNFSDNIAPLVSKKPPLALNIPTFINLYGYGYRNIWELADLVSTKDVDWVGFEPVTGVRATD
jgi:hypothetical protein